MIELSKGSISPKSK